MGMTFPMNFQFWTRQRAFYFLLKLKLKAFELSIVVQTEKNITEFIP